MELQGRQVRIVFSRSERDTEVDVHDANERLAVGNAGHNRAHQGFSCYQGFGDRCLMELSGEEKDQAVQAANTRCA